jgi:hypothetical protein
MICTLAKSSWSAPDKEEPQTTALFKKSLAQYRRCGSCLIAKFVIDLPQACSWWANREKTRLAFCFLGHAHTCTRLKLELSI